MITYLSWWYAQEPIYLWRAVNVVSGKIIQAFSVPVLLRTLFDPWKRDIQRVENASLDVRYHIWVENMLSRLVGFVVRIFTILTGIMFSTFVFIFLTIVLLVWLLAPILILFLFLNGINVIING